VRPDPTGSQAVRNLSVGQCLGGLEQACWVGRAIGARVVTEVSAWHCQARLEKIPASYYSPLDWAEGEALGQADQAS